MTCVVIYFGIGWESLGHMTWKLMKNSSLDFHNKYLYTI